MNCLQIRVTPLPSSSPTVSAMSSGLAAALQRPDRAGSVDGIRRFMLFRGLFRGEWHPEVMGAVEREAFLSDLAVKSKVALSIRNHAPNAIVFYRQY